MLQWHFRETVIGLTAVAIFGVTPLRLIAQEEEESSVEITAAPAESDTATMEPEAAPAEEQAATVIPSETTGLGGLERMRALPSNSFGEPQLGVPYSSIFRETGATFSNPLRNPDVGMEPKIGEATGEFHLWHGGLRLPPLAQRGFEPQNADIKIGLVFIKFRSLSGTVLYTDNVNLNNNRRNSDTTVITRLDFTIICQITESFRFTFGGGLIYLPIEGKVSLFLGGWPFSYLLGLEAAPILLGQITYTTNIGNWPVTFADDLHMGVAGYSINTSSDFRLFDQPFIRYTNEPGNYVFRAPDAAPEANTNRPHFHDREFTYLSNSLSAATERLLPTDTRLHVRMFHENLWYNQGGRGLPDLRDGANVLLMSQRENLRFKPYARYEIWHIGNRAGIDQTFSGGFFGPITDQLFLRAEAGYFIRSTGLSSMLWHMSLWHEAGPLTREFLYCGRSLSDFHDEISTYIGYSIRQTLAEDLFGDAFVRASRIDSAIGHLQHARDEMEAGLRFTYVVSPKTELRLSGIYAHTTRDDAISTQDSWLGRFEMNYRFTDTFTARLFYQYWRLDATRQQDSFYENLVLLTLVKYFQ